MPTVYVRRVNLKDSLSDAEVVAYWKFTMAEVVPALQKIPGIRSVKLYSGAGGLRADLRYVFEWMTPEPTSACWLSRKYTHSWPKPMPLGT
jgi:hypothetical protein